MSVKFVFHLGKKAHSDYLNKPTPEKRGKGGSIAGTRGISMTKACSTSKHFACFGRLCTCHCHTRGA